MIDDITITVRCDGPGCDCRLSLPSWDVECVSYDQVITEVKENKWVVDDDENYFCSESCQELYEKEQEYYEPGIYTYSKGAHL